MKKLKKILSIVVILMCISTLCYAEEGVPVVTSLEDEATPINDTDELSDEELLAQEYEDGENPDGEDVTGDEHDEVVDVHEGDYNERGETIDVSKAINGNAYIFGTDVTITGMIYGDLYVAATSSLTFAKGSVVFGNVFAYAPKIQQTGVISSLYAIASEEYICDYEGTAEFDLKVFTKRITFHGYVQRHVYFWASEYIDFTEDTYIVGNLTYYANDVNKHEEAIIKGETYANPFEGSSDIFNDTVTYGSLTISFITTIILLLVAFLAILLVKPSAVSNACEHLTSSPLKTFGCGAAALVVITILIVAFFCLSALRTVGFMLVAALIISLPLSIVIVTIGLAKYLDEKIKKTKDSNSILAYVLIVIVLFWVLFQIPYVQAISVILIWLFGLGTMTVSALSGKEKESIDNANTSKE